MLLSLSTRCPCDACGDVTSGRFSDLEERPVPHCCRVFMVLPVVSDHIPPGHQISLIDHRYCRSVAQTALWTTVLSCSVLDLLLNLCVCVIDPSLQPLSCISWPWRQLRLSAGLLLDMSSAEKDPVRAEICLITRCLRAAHDTLALVYCHCGCFSRC